MNKYADLYFKHLKEANLEAVGNLNPFPVIANAITAPARNARKAFNDFVEQAKNVERKYPQKLQPDNPRVLLRPKVQAPVEVPEVSTKNIFGNMEKPNPINFK